MAISRNKKGHQIRIYVSIIFLIISTFLTMTAFIMSTDGYRIMTNRCGSEYAILYPEYGWLLVVLPIAILSSVLSIISLIFASRFRLASLSIAITMLTITIGANLAFQSLRCII